MMRRKKSRDDEALLHLTEKEEEEKFEVSFIDTYVGHGVFTKENIRAGELLMEYRGKLLRLNDNADFQDTTFVYYFQHERKDHCIDATDDTCIARMVNDIDYATRANCKAKKVIVHGVPRLGLFALKDIAKGTELRYDYGSGLAPWRKRQKNDTRPALYKQPSPRKEQKNFVCSGSIQIKDQLRELVTRFGGIYMEEFDSKATHVIMETKERGCRICPRTLKYFLGIAHHCWILDYEYIQKSLEAGYYLPEDGYEIMGNEVTPSCSGPAISRQTMTPFLQGFHFKFTGENEDLSKDEAEEIVLALGGAIGGEDAPTISLEENGDLNTVSRDWLFDMLCFYQYLEPNSYIQQNLRSHERDRCRRQSNDRKCSLSRDRERSRSWDRCRSQGRDHRHSLNRDRQRGRYYRRSFRKNPVSDGNTLISKNLEAQEQLDEDSTEQSVTDTEQLVSQALVNRNLNAQEQSNKEGLVTQNLIDGNLNAEEQSNIYTEQSVTQSLIDGNLKAEEQSNIEGLVIQSLTDGNLKAEEQSNIEGLVTQSLTDGNLKAEEQSNKEGLVTQSLTDGNLKAEEQSNIEGLVTQSLTDGNLKAEEQSNIEGLVTQSLIDGNLKAEEQSNKEGLVTQSLTDGNLKAEEQSNKEGLVTQSLTDENLKAEEQSNKEGLVTQSLTDGNLKAEEQSNIEGLVTQSLTDGNLKAEEQSNIEGLVTQSLTDGNLKAEEQSNIEGLVTQSLTDGNLKAEEQSNIEGLVTQSLTDGNLNAEEQSNIYTEQSVTQSLIDGNLNAEEQSNMYTEQSVTQSLIDGNLKAEEQSNMYTEQSVTQSLIDGNLNAEEQSNIEGLVTQNLIDGKLKAEEQSNMYTEQSVTQSLIDGNLNAEEQSNMYTEQSVTQSLIDGNLKAEEQSNMYTEQSVTQNLIDGNLNTEEQSNMYTEQFVTQSLIDGNLNAEEQSNMYTEQSVTQSLIDGNLNAEEQSNMYTEQSVTQNLIDGNLKAEEQSNMYTEQSVTQSLIDGNLNAEEHSNMYTEQSVTQSLIDQNLNAEEQSNIYTEQSVTHNLIDGNLNAEEQSNIEGLVTQNLIDGKLKAEEQSNMYTEQSVTQSLIDGNLKAEEQSNMYTEQSVTQNLIDGNLNTEEQSNMYTEQFVTQSLIDGNLNAEEQSNMYTEQSVTQSLIDGNLNAEEQSNMYTEQSVTQNLIDGNLKAEEQSNMYTEQSVTQSLIDGNLNAEEHSNMYTEQSVTQSLIDQNLNAEEQSNIYTEQSVTHNLIDGNLNAEEQSNMYTEQSVTQSLIDGNLNAEEQSNMYTEQSVTQSLIDGNLNAEEQSNIYTEQSVTQNLIDGNLNAEEQSNMYTEQSVTQSLIDGNLKAEEQSNMYTEQSVTQSLIDGNLNAEEQSNMYTEQSVTQSLIDGNLNAKEQSNIYTEQFVTHNLIDGNLNAEEQSNMYTEQSVTQSLIDGNLKAEEQSEAQDMDTEGYFDRQSITDTEQSDKDVSNLESSYVDDSEDEDYIPSQESENESVYSESESTIYPAQDYGNNEIIMYRKQIHDNNNSESRKCPTQVLDTDNLNNPVSALSVRDKQCVETETGVNVQHQTIKIAVSKKTKDGRRVWDKKHACVYCKKQYAKLARHLEQVHANDIDVQRALAFNKNSKERKEAWREIMNRGNFAHNVKVLEKQQGEIIPFKRPSKEADGLKYVQCATCLGTFRSSVLWRHVKNCHPEGKNKTTKLKKHHQVSSAALFPVSGVVADNFREIILNRMANDAVSLAARNDNDIVRYGQKKFQKSARNPHQNQYVRQKMRELARFLVSIRAIDSTVIRLRDCIDSIKFSVCVKAVKELCGYNEDDFTFKIPSLANKIGQSLHKVARQLRIEAAKTGDYELRRKAKCFIEVYIEDWETEISHSALQTLETEKYNKPTRIPLAQDLKALTTYLKREAAILLELFESNEATETEWRELCKVTLAETVLFNKRRSGEAERLEVKQYLNGIQQGKNNQEEVLQSLSPLEKKLSEVVDRIEIRGKRGRRVAILVHDNLRKQLDILVKNRFLGRIDESNKYMFARPGDAEFPVRAADVLRKYANECGAKHPELLNSTSFRKHIAVIVQMLNLKDNELDVLADFLGHDIRVHREFYRLPQDTIQVAKISKLLIEMEKGNIQLYKGKSLDEIQFDLEEPLESEQDSDDDESNKTIITNESTPRTYNEGTPTTSKTTPTTITKATTKKVKTTGKTTPTTINKATTSEKVKTGGKRKMWTSEEEASVKRHLGKYFFLNQLPGKCEIEEVRKKEPILSNRPWIQIKSFIKNKKISMKRKLGK